MSDAMGKLGWGGPLDALRALYWDKGGRHIAAKGNCFGMCAESINATRHRSAFSLLLKRFTTWAEVEPTFNVRHMYQIGLDFMLWFTRDFLKGNTHNPEHV